MAKNEQSVSATRISAGLASLNGKLGKAQHEVQRLAVMITVHAIKFGDITGADKLCSIVKAHGMRNDSLAKWFVERSCAKIRTTKMPDGKEVKTFGVDAGKREEFADAIAKTSEATFTTDLMKHRWDEAKAKVDTYAGFDLDVLIRSLAKRADAALKTHGSDPKTKVDRDKLAKLKAIYLFDGPAATSEVISEGATLN